MKKEIVVRCTGSDWLALEEMFDFQGDLKTLSEEDAQRLKNLIIKKGFRYPFFCWKDKDGKVWLNDGHQRHKVLPLLAKEGWKLPEKYPVVYIEAEDESEAGELILYQSNKFGKIEDEGFYNFLHAKGLAEKWDLIMPDLNFAELDVQAFDLGWMKDIALIEDDIKEKEIDENSLETEHECPKCGYKW